MIHAEVHHRNGGVAVLGDHAVVTHALHGLLAGFQLSLLLLDLLRVDTTLLQDLVRVGTRGQVLLQLLDGLLALLQLLATVHELLPPVVELSLRLERVGGAVGLVDALDRGDGVRDTLPLLLGELRAVLGVEDHAARTLVGLGQLFLQTVSELLGFGAGDGDRVGHLHTGEGHGAHGDGQHGDPRNNHRPRVTG